jgi:hypothetical protein
MKTKLISIILLMTLLLSVAYAIEAPTLDITLINQDPDPAGPGDYVELRFKVVNTQAGSNAKDLMFRLKPQFPFSLDPSEDEEKSFGNLPALGDAGNALIVKYKLLVDDDAVQGSNKIHLEYKHDLLGWIAKEFTVDIQTVDANIAIVSVNTNPEKIRPGEESEVQITVRNMADSTVKDVSFKLDLTYDNLLSGATSKTATDSINAFNELPFAPIESASEKKIDSLKSGEEVVFTYRLISYSDAESKVYKIPVEINYYDELETKYTKNDLIGLVVGSQPDLSVIIDETSLYVGKKTGTVTVRFINKGFSDIKFLDVKLPSNGAYELLSAEEVYVGNVDSDDYETAEFELYLKEDSREESIIKLPLSVEYRDANNNIYSNQVDLDLRIVTAEKKGVSAGGSPVGLIVVIVIIVGGIWYFRKKRKKNTKK